MAKWGVDFYGLSRFGNDPSLVRSDFSVQPFKAVPTSYSSLSLTWQHPQAPTCTQIQLVRNSASTPAFESDGLVLFSQPAGGLLNFQDSTASPGFNYYSMFGWDSTNKIWVQSGDLIAILPMTWSYWYQMYNLLPAMYRDRDYISVPFLTADSGIADDIEVTTSVIQNTPPPLQRYFQLLGFQLDYTRTIIDSLLNTTNPLTCSGGLLPYIASQLGMPYEPQIGMARERLLLSNAIHLYKIKGSPQGISEFVSTLTGWGVLAITMGLNRLLDLDSSVMTAGLGNWALTASQAAVGAVPAINVGATITQIPNLLAVTTDPTVNIGFIPGAGFLWAYTNTGMRLTAGGAVGWLKATLAPIPINSFLGAPNAAGVAVGDITMQFQVWTPAAGTARQIVITLVGDNGTTLTTTIPTATAPGAWRTVTASFVCTTASGVNYYTPQVMVQGTGTNVALAANENVYMTFVGVYAADATDLTNAVTELGWAGPFDFPRDLKISLLPTRSNLIGNTLTFNRPATPAPPPGQGIDGWSGYSVPTDPTSTQLATLDEVFPSAVNGNGSMLVRSKGYAVTNIFGGGVSAVVAEPLPAGWILTTDWYNGGGTGYTTPRTWFNSGPGSNQWFVEEEGYFDVGLTSTNGQWFQNPVPVSSASMLTLLPTRNLYYTFSVYVQALQNDVASTTAYAGIWWHYTLNDGSMVSQITLGNPFTLTSTGYQRIYVTTAPPIFKDANGVSYFPDGMLSVVQFQGAPQYAGWLFNSAMLEPSPSLGTYFDSGQSAGTADYFNDVHGSSFFFPRRAPKMNRLNALLPYFVPIGATWTLLFTSTAPSYDPTTI